ncbi:MAG TPA: acyl-[acyl-carrier-protein]--UDP-N-acetylglucosamine O-acyltransferase, partial [Casimicrobiaceae bacterium]|nr:acyl-[acyl-carrier-protein]--UDP-N-acetylglucosamine O-acyltransferase [Casimicrobiaceae bacterium]
AGSPAKPAGTNNEGLRRRGFSADDINAVRRAYKTLYRKELALAEARAEIVTAARETPVLATLAEFLAEEGRGRGIVR